MSLYLNDVAVCCQLEVFILRVDDDFSKWGLDFGHHFGRRQMTGSGFFCKPKRRESGYSTQLKVLSTAFSHSRQCFSLTFDDMAGCQVLSTAQFCRNSSRSVQNPTANPAA